ncbi:MAG: response regulator [Deltaproteobacteria bacterium]|nr:response regulator [Deltaproteobacteria bacterium]
MDEMVVLIVDDDPRILQLAKSFLEREGMAVCCAACGEEALRLVQEKTFSLMITDLHMPGMKGFELAGKVSEIAPGMPVFMITGDISGEIQCLAREAGILKVFAKPLRFLEIMATVRGAFEG